MEACIVDISRRNVRMVGSSRTHTEADLQQGPEARLRIGSLVSSKKLAKLTK